MNDHTNINNATSIENSVPSVPSVPLTEASIFTDHSQSSDATGHGVPAVCQGVPSDDKRIQLLSVPADAPQPPSRHPSLGSFHSRWTYKNKEGDVAGFICRFNKKNGDKDYRPLTLWQNPDNGYFEWRWKGFSDPRPIYNLDLLSANPDASVIICEGEKAADAAAHLFPNYITTTSMNGAKSAGKADWNPLKGRNVYLWPDNDEAGREGVQETARLLNQIGAKSIRIMQLNYFTKSPNGEIHPVPEKWDAADAVDEGFTSENLQEFFSNPDNAPLYVRSIDEVGKDILYDLEAFSDFQLIVGTEGFRDGVHFISRDKHGNPNSPRWICSPLRVIAVTRSNNQDGWGRFLEWEDRDGHLHRWAAPMAMTIGDGIEFCKELADRGVDIDSGPKVRDLILRYVTTANQRVKARCTEKTGWHGSVYVTPYKTLGETDELIIFQSSAGNVSNFGESGLIEQWREHLSSLCHGNSRLLFALSAAFAAILIELVNDENGGFHFVGPSSQGKSSVLLAAASVFGGHNFMRHWNATVNGIEAIAAAHSGAILILDELSQCDPKGVGEAIYLIANGFGKQRANRGGGAKLRKLWRVFILSSGEIDLAQHMREAGKKSRAGQEVRLLAIPANPTVGYGVHESLNGFADGAALSDAIKEASRKFYGVAGVLFIEAIAKEFSSIKERVSLLRNGFIARNLPVGATGQVQRAAHRFGLCAAAGELATEFGITGWTSGEAEKGVAVCYKSWLENWGGVCDHESRAILAQIRAHFEAHGEYRYTDVRDDNSMPRIINDRGGFKKPNQSGSFDYIVFPEVFKNELCLGYNPTDVSRLLASLGIIEPDSGGKFTRPLKLPGFPDKKRYTVIKGDRLWDNE